MSLMVLYAMGIHEYQGTTFIRYRNKHTRRNNIVYLSSSGLGNIALDINVWYHCRNSVHNRLSSLKGTVECFYS